MISKAESVMDVVRRGRKMVVEELIPCPFCGEVYELDFDAFRSGGTWVVCGHCGCEGPYSRDKQEAIAAWNKRHEK